MIKTLALLGRNQMLNPMMVGMEFSKTISEISTICEEKKYWDDPFVYLEV